MTQATKIKGITVTLIKNQKTGEDSFGAPIYSTERIDVPNVLVSPSSSDDIVNSTSLYSKKAIYTLAIPKGDMNEWEDTYVEFFGYRWHTFGFVQEGIESMIPLDWNKKVMVERYG